MSFLYTGTYFILYDFIEKFTKDGPNCMDNTLFLETVDDVFKNLTAAQRSAIRFQVGTVSCTQITKLVIIYPKKETKTFFVKNTKF